MGRWRFALSLLACIGFAPECAPPRAPATRTIASAAPPVASASIAAPPPTAGPVQAPHDDEPIAIEHREPLMWRGDGLGPADFAAGKALCNRVETDHLIGVRHAPTCVDAGGGGFDARMLVENCIPFRGGAWAIRVRVLNADPRCATLALGGDAVHALWYPVHATPSGRAEGRGRAFTGGGFHRVHFAQAVFDYDGDGEPELFVLTRTETHTGDGPGGGEIFTFKRGVVQSYAPAGSITIASVQDVDEDGRPDLLYEGPYSAPYVPYGRTSNAHTAVGGPVFVAHWLPDGTFSRDDAFARSYAERGCPRMPSSIVARLKDDAHVDDEQSLYRVRCARLRGMPAAELRARISAECEAPGKDDSCVAKGERVCLLRDTMLAWADAEPPLRL